MAAETAPSVTEKAMPQKLQQSIEDELADRESDFYANFGGAEFFEVAYIQIVERVADILSILFGEDVADTGLDEIAGLAFHQNGRKWRELLEEEFNGIYSETAFGVTLHNLTAYGKYGIVSLPGSSVESREHALEQEISRAKHLIELVPAERWNLETSQLLRVVETAAARWKLDHGEPLTAPDLSLLSGRALQTIFNLLSTDRIVGRRERIEAKDAMAWLSHQKGFKSSLWRDQVNEIEPPEDLHHMTKSIFVPVASDGTLFNPTLQRKGSFVLDGGDRELEIGDFDAALAELQRMRTPTWRRPTPGGSWTWVRGVAWTRVERDELVSYSPANAN